MKGSNQCLRVLNREGIDLRPIPLLETHAPKFASRVEALGMIAVTKVKSTPQNTDGVVVRLLAPRLAIGDLDQARVTDAME
jgi:hypothetical protein